MGENFQLCRVAFNPPCQQMGTWLREDDGWIHTPWKGHFPNITSAESSSGHVASPRPNISLAPNTSTFPYPAAPHCLLKKIPALQITKHSDNGTSWTVAQCPTGAPPTSGADRVSKITASSLCSSRGGLLKGSQALGLGAWGVSLAFGHWKVAGLGRAKAEFGVNLKVLKSWWIAGKTQCSPRGWLDSAGLQ